MCSKFVLILIFGVVSGYVMCAVEVEETTTTYTTRYDNINLYDLLKNDRMRKAYVSCLLNEGPCTPDGSELKSNMINPYKS